MALDIVPRKATGSALGMVGLASYGAAGIQNVVSGFMIGAGGEFNYLPVSMFWMAACLLSFLIPVLTWRLLKIQSIR
jgi:OPA family sugar phosphate sensor protein UhpC-like MFS transporter